MENTRIEEIRAATAAGKPNALELSRLAGLSPSTVYSALAGNPTMETYSAMCRGLDQWKEQVKK